MNKNDPPRQEETIESLDAEILEINREMVKQANRPTPERINLLLEVLRASPQPNIEALEPDNLQVIYAMNENAHLYGPQLSELKGWLKGRWQLVQRALKQIRREHQAGDRPLRAVGSDEQAKVLDAIPDAPVNEQHIIPRDWSLRDEQVDASACVLRLAAGEDGVCAIPIVRRPVVIVAWIKNLTTGAKCLEVAWKANWKWRFAVIERDRLFDASRIIPALAARGFPVNAHNRADLIKYLADYEDTNLYAMPVRAVSEQMGWIGKQAKVFLVGKQTISSGTSGATQHEISFRPPDVGEEQLAAAVAPHGDFGAWAAAIAKFAPYPRVILGVYASLSAPLLEFLQIPGFIVDWSYRTSTGKSVVLRAAASVWGNPDERSAASLVSTWNTTLVGFERVAGALRNLPVILDDTKVATRPQLVADILYQAVAGHGKTRGSVLGARRTSTWRTAVLSTGERKATDFTKDAGSAARCLALWGNPFGHVGEDVATLIQSVECELFTHHGHAGPRFVEWLLGQNRDALAERYRRHHAEIWDRMRQRIDVAVASRAGYAIAAIDFAGELAHEALGLPWAYVCPWDQVLEDAVESLRDIDRAKQALDYAYSWAVAHQDQFYLKRDMGAYSSPPTEWAGAWAGQSLAFIRPVLERILDLAGYEFNPIIRQWKERGWLQIGDGKHIGKRIAVGDSATRPRCIALSEDALRLLTEDTE